MPSETYNIDTPLTFVNRDRDRITFHAHDLVLEKDGDIVEACYLTLGMDLEMYQRIDQGAWFNLAVDVREIGWERGFKSDRPIEIEAKLVPHLLFSLFSTGATAASIAVDLFKASAKATSTDTDPDEMLLTENWYALYVKQEIPLPPGFGEGSLKEGYRTQWVD
jgi:hypothetical protein